MRYTVADYPEIGGILDFASGNQVRRNPLVFAADPFWRGVGCYMGTSLIRNCLPLGTYCRTMPRALWKP